MTQSEIAHGLDRRARAHEATSLVTGKMIEHRGRAVLEHFHAAQDCAGVEILLAHVAQRRSIISAPDFQRLARHHAADEIRRGVAMRVDHAGHRDHSISLDRLVEWTSRSPFHWTDERHPVAIDHDRTLFNNVVVVIHRDDESITNQSFHFAPLGIIAHGSAFRQKQQGHGMPWPCANHPRRPIKTVPDARRATIDERRRTLAVRWSESGKRNEAGGPFSSVLYKSHLSAPVLRVLQEFKNLPARVLSEITFAQTGIQNVIP